MKWVSIIECKIYVALKEIVRMMMPWTENDMLWRWYKKLREGYNEEVIHTWAVYCEGSTALTGGLGGDEQGDEGMTKTNGEPIFVI